MMGAPDLDGTMSENERHGEDTPKRAADDVAAEMEHRLGDLEHDIESARRKADAIEPDAATGLAGDATAAPEGPLSRGGVLGATDRHSDDDDG
jgi:hypothetical protein